VTTPTKETPPKRQPARKKNDVAKTLRLTDEQKHVLDMAIEFYIRLGLGQFSEIATRQLCEEMEDLCWRGERPWNLKDEDTSAFTLTAFEMEARLAGNLKNARWADRRIRERAAKEPLDPQE
jgi:hypothetical protein